MYARNFKCNNRKMYFTISQDRMYKHNTGCLTKFKISKENRAAFNSREAEIICVCVWVRFCLHSADQMCPKG